MVFDPTYAEEDGLVSKLEKESLSVVTVNESKQIASGIKTLMLNPVQHQAEYEAIGKVISIQPLLALRERYLTVQAELEGAKARQKLAIINLNRQKELFNSGIAPKRSLQNQETQSISDQASVAASQAKLLAIVGEAQLNWGKILAEWAFSVNTNKLNGFISANRHLLQITLPANKQLATDTESIVIEPTGDRSKAQSATLISSAVLVDNAKQGVSYFFQSDSSGLTIGMKVTAWISQPDSEETGFIIPESALIWYLNQAYVYSKTGEEIFTRRLLKNISAIYNGYFITEGLSTGDEIVITGGQMLLSEELKNQIPSED